MLRPERLQILGDKAPDDMNILQGTVQDIVYQGESFLLQALLADGHRVSLRGASTRLAMAAIPKPGASVLLGLGAEDTILLADDLRA